MNKPLAVVFILSLALTRAGAENSSRASYLRHMRSDIDDMTKQLHQLERSSSRIAKDRQADFQKNVHVLWKKERLARIQLKHLDHTSESEWKKLRAHEDYTMIHLRKSYRYVVNHFIKES